MTKPLKIGIVMDPIASITPYKDTTLALMLAAQKKGHQLFYMQLDDLSITPAGAYGSMTPLKVFDDNQHWFELDVTPQLDKLSSLDVILMRKDPPFDNEYIYATYILERAEQDGCLVVNKPQSLRDCNEKIFATEFPQCSPPHIVTRSMAALKEFHDTHKDVIFKPLDGMGGSSIFRCKPDDPNISVILETLTHHGECFIMGQQFIPDITNGDKRVLMVNGKPIPFALARIPAQGETRGNIAAGGKGVPQPLSDRDKWIANQIGPKLIEKGLLFVGLDIIGNYLTEINVTSPTCAREIDNEYNTDIGGHLINAIEHLALN